MKRKLKLGSIKINTKLAEEFNEYNQLSKSEDAKTNASESEQTNSTHYTDKDKTFTFNPKTFSAFDNEFLINGQNKQIIKVRDNLYISDLESAEDQQLLDGNSVTHAINLVWNDKSKLLSSITYFNASLRDNLDCEIIDTWKEVSEFIESSLKTNSSANFLFYCKKGVSRSVSVMIGYMMNKYKITMKDALNIIKIKKTNIDPNLSFLGQLKTYEESLGLDKTNSVINSPSDTEQGIVEDRKVWGE
jgi:cellulose biosynthesis protein BcsQ